MHKIRRPVGSRSLSPPYFPSSSFTHSLHVWRFKCSLPLCVNTNPSQEAQMNYTCFHCTYGICTSIKRNLMTNYGLSIQHWLPSLLFAILLINEMNCRRLWTSELRPFHSQFANSSSDDGIADKAYFSAALKFEIILGSDRLCHCVCTGRWKEKPFLWKTIKLNLFFFVQIDWIASNLYSHRPIKYKNSHVYGKRTDQAVMAMAVAMANG